MLFYSLASMYGNVSQSYRRQGLMDQIDKLKVVWKDILLH